MKSFRIEFDDDMKFSLNKIWAGWRGMQWVRKALANDWHYWSEKSIEEVGLKPIKGQVYILFYFKFMKNMLDSSNVAPMAKCIEDTLTKQGILVSDTNADVKAVLYTSIDQPTKVRKLMEHHIVDVVILEEWDKDFRALRNMERVYAE